MRKSFTALVAVVAMIAGVTAASATLDLSKTSTKAKGDTTVTWDSSFTDLDYTLGDTITMKVYWSVDAGAASYDSFEAKKFTPRSKKDPAECTGPTCTAPTFVPGADTQGTYVAVTFNFTGLHLDKKRNVDIGNAHFKLYLMVDKDGDGIPETKAGFGVNMHAEDPQ